MKKTIFIRNHSPESDKAESLLKELSIDYITIVTDSEYGTPSVIVPDSAYSYQGYAEIAEFARTLTTR